LGKTREKKRGEVQGIELRSLLWGDKKGTKGVRKVCLKRGCGRRNGKKRKVGRGASVKKKKRKKEEKTCL